MEATEEAILNSLFAGTDMVGIQDRLCPGIPHDEVERLFKKYKESLNL